MGDVIVTDGWTSPRIDPLAIYTISGCYQRPRTVRQRWQWWLWRLGFVRSAPPLQKFHVRRVV